MVAGSERTILMMLTFTGKNFDVLTFSEKDFDIVDVGHANSLNCRYNGHCKRQYSVAQHSNIVYNMLFTLEQNWETCLYGLLHDGAEAYLSDVPTPVKALIPEYSKWEDKVLDVILTATGKAIYPDNPKRWLESVNYELVHKVDKSMVFYEMRELFDNRPADFYFKDVLMLPQFTIASGSFIEHKTAFINNYNWLVESIKNNIRYTEIPF
jgi:hypothetical protein